MQPLPLVHRHLQGCVSNYPLIVIVVADPISVEMRQCSLNYEVSDGQSMVAYTIICRRQRGAASKELQLNKDSRRIKHTAVN